MTKSILKEIIIVLLLCLAIILVLGILLYDYVPISKTIPNQVAYTTPEDVKQELLGSGTLDTSQVIMTYEVNSDDLNNYKRVKDYNPGKANPFSSYETTTVEKSENNANGTNANSNGSNTGTSGNTNTSTGNNNSTGQNNTTGGSSSGNTTSGGRFFQDKGTK